jgi:8-oxo-dGTP diphosphatase
MSSLEEAGAHIASTFGFKVRLRACGILIHEDRILLVKHLGLGLKGELWSPPGGGIEFGETLTQAVEREFVEETGLHVTAGDWQFLYEYVRPPLHTIECFFSVLPKSNPIDFQLGTEPETKGNSPILVDIRYWSFEEIQAVGLDYFHGLFSQISSYSDIGKLKHFTSMP